MPERENGNAVCTFEQAEEFRLLMYALAISLEDVVKVESADKLIETADKTKTSMQAQRIIEYIKENGFIPTLTSCEILKLKSSRTKEIIKTMVDKNILSAIGDRKLRKYILKQAD